MPIRELVQIAQLPVRAVGALIDVTVMFIALFVGLFLTALTIRQFDTAFTAAARRHWSMCASAHSASDPRTAPFM